jgi:hypothetical protein
MTQSTSEASLGLALRRGRIKRNFKMEKEYKMKRRA